MPENEQPRRNDDHEEFGDEMGIPAPQSDRNQIQEWTTGMVGECHFCNLSGGIPEICRRDDGTAGCPRCGSDLAFYHDRQGQETEMIDLTRNWRPGQTGRCDTCGMVARVFNDVRRDDETAGCEMCGTGTFEFIYGLPESGIRAPAPRPVYPHEIEDMTIMLRRRVDLVALGRILTLLRAGNTIDQILNSTEEGFQMMLESDHVNKQTLEDIKRAENLRRWDRQEQLLYSPDEIERLNAFKMLRVPFPGRMKIRFAGSRGPIERWLRPEIFETLRGGQSQLVFDGHYKVVETTRIAEEPRFDIARRFFPKCNALLGRGVIKAWSLTGEEIPLEEQPWTDPTIVPPEERGNGDEQEFCDPPPGGTPLNLREINLREATENDNRSENEEGEEEEETTEDPDLHLPDES